MTYLSRFFNRIRLLDHMYLIDIYFIYCLEYLLGFFHPNPPGINLVHNQVTVSRVVVREAFNAGWRVGDVILEVDGKQARWMGI